MWVVRNKNGALLLYYDYPQRCITEDIWIRKNNCIFLDSDMYPQYKWIVWETEPVEVELASSTDFSYKLSYYATWLCDSPFIEKTFGDKKSAISMRNHIASLGATNIHLSKHLQINI